MKMKKYYKFRYENKLYSRFEASHLGKTRLSKDGKILRVFNNDGLDCKMILTECNYGQKYVNEQPEKSKIKIKKEEEFVSFNKIDDSNVKYFGTDVERVNDKKGQFKSFKKINWIELVDGTKHIVNDGITILKQRFPNFESTKWIHKENKNGKIKKATSWKCIIVEANTRFINEENSHIIHESIKNKTLFTLDHTNPFYYVYGNVFRDSQNDCLVYADLNNCKLINIKLEKHNRENLEKWIKENINVD